MTKRKRPAPDVPFTRILNSLMQEKGLSVRKAAEAAGVGSSTIMSWKSGALPENYVAVKRLAKKLGTNLGFLLTGEDDTREGGPPLVGEAFDDAGTLFDGFAKITIQRLVPRNTQKGK